MNAPKTHGAPNSPGVLATRNVRALVVRTAGTNCDRETCLALERGGASPELKHVLELCEKPALLDPFSIFVIPGGFSYGDDLGAGRVLGFQLRTHLADALARFVAKGGVVLGVCNGFQVLADTGLLEGVRTARAERGVGLDVNASGRFECRWVTLKAEASACAWLEPGELLPVPVAHGEGRFTVRDAGVLQRLKQNRQIALRYVRPDGSRAEYPDCPNGSVEEIAGICDPTGRVLGLMPHPERNLTPWNHPRWTRLGPRAEGEGLRFYRRMVETASALAK
ncbi:MAG: phosphoribosylformylglycinamidine synthase I [Planctomycetes bacterium]|nr:phosphoribosylformylglycinamidine synthase I [Planctomycetota bacterium]